MLVFMWVGPRAVRVTWWPYPECSYDSSPDNSPNKATILVIRCLFAHMRRTLQQKTIDFGPLSEERFMRSVIAELSR